jgi:hypothetical protein
MSAINDDLIPEAPTESVATEPPVRETADAKPLPGELQSRLEQIERQDISPAGRAA